MNTGRKEREEDAKDTKKKNTSAHFASSSRALRPIKTNIRHFEHF
jgi:hypothetical protein